MTASRKILIFGGLILATVSMLYGVYYALFIEHQTLAKLGGSLATSFVRAAERQEPESQAALAAYIAAKFDYVRQVDCHSHWVGLGMLMIVLGFAFDAVAFPESIRRVMAWGMLIGSILFPLGVILQTVDHSPWFRGLAVIGSALVIASLASVAVGFARSKAD